MTFKTHCPCCGRKKGIKTLFSQMGFTFYQCYKCGAGGAHSPIKIPPYRGLWQCPPASEKTPYSAAA